jgi:hypothetical protein
MHKLNNIRIQSLTDYFCKSENIKAGRTFLTLPQVQSCPAFLFNLEAAA